MTDKKQVKIVDNDSDDEDRIGKNLTKLEDTSIQSPGIFKRPGEHRNSIRGKVLVNIPYKSRGRGVSYDDNILSDEDNDYTKDKDERGRRSDQKYRERSSLSAVREESMQILRENDNLDLDTYKQYMNEFYKFSGDLFEFDHTIFQKKVRDPQEVIENRLRRSSANEYELTEKQLTRDAANKGSSSPERILGILKKLPPFEGDNIP